LTRAGRFAKLIFFRKSGFAKELQAVHRGGELCSAAKNTAANVYCNRVGADIIRLRFLQQLQ
jgi:hypothetical protein